MPQTAPELPLSLRETSKAPVQPCKPLPLLFLWLYLLLKSSTLGTLVSLCSVNTPGTLLSQVFHTGCSPDIHKLHSINSFQYLVRCLLLHKTYLNRLTYSEDMLNGKTKTKNQKNTKHTYTQKKTRRKEGTHGSCLQGITIYWASWTINRQLNAV